MYNVFIFHAEDIIMKITKKILALLLAAIMLFAVGTAAFAEDGTTTKFSIISSNVAGLPIPSMFDENGKKVPVTQKIMGQQLNESGIDIICVQEDFQFHSILAEQMTNYPYTTYTSGGVPVGDGMNIFSKYPIYNVDRIAWEEFNGILDAANDGLTPKGFLKCTADINGVLVDIYDIHVDANGSYEDCMAKKAQFNQLCKYMDENSADRPIAIVGDYNATLHGDIAAELYPIMIQDAGFSDGWTVFCNDGVYFTNYLSTEETAYYDAKWGGYYWGRWDSVERLLFRDGGGAKLSVTDFRYIDYNELAGQPLTDHNVMAGELTIDTTDYARPALELNTEAKKPAIWSLTHTVKMFVRCISLLLKDLFTKLFAGELF